MAVSLGALIFCEVLLGIPGLILAIPLALFIRHEFEHIPGLSTTSLEQPTASDLESLTECEISEPEPRVAQKIR